MLCHVLHLHTSTIHLQELARLMHHMAETVSSHKTSVSVMLRTQSLKHDALCQLATLDLYMLQLPVRICTGSSDCEHSACLVMP